VSFIVEKSQINDRKYPQGANFFMFACLFGWFAFDKKCHFCCCYELLWSKECFAWFDYDCATITLALLCCFLSLREREDLKRERRERIGLVDGEWCCEDERKERKISLLSILFILGRYSASQSV